MTNEAVEVDPQQSEKEMKKIEKIKFAKMIKKLITIGMSAYFK